MTIDREWAADYLQALKDGDTETCKAKETDLEAALTADPLHVGLRSDADWPTALKAAAQAHSDAVAATVLEERLSVRIAAETALDDTRKPDSRDWLIEDWLPAGRIGILTGAGESGKSRLAVQLACAVAASAGGWLPATGGYSGVMPAVKESGAAVIASWEDEPAELARRRYWMHHGSQLKWASAKRIGSNLHRLDLREHGPLWGPSEQGSGHVATTGGLTLAGEAVRRYCESCDTRLLVLDPLAAVYGSDENVRALVRGFMAHWDAWGQVHGCAVMLLAHPPKSDADYSGSTDWHSAARWMWTLKRQPSGYTRMKDGRIVSAKNGEGENLQGMRLELGKSNYRTSGGPRPAAWLRRMGDGPAWEQCSAEESALALTGQATAKGKGADGQPDAVMEEADDDPF